MANAISQRCFTKRAQMSGPPLIQNGHLTLQTHDIGWIVAGIFTISATAISLWLLGKHLIWYTKKRQQRYIVRLLLMVPIYAVVSLASYIFWNHAIPITLVRDSYESFVLYSFFYLLLQYLSPTIEGQKEVFRRIVLQKWIFPLGSVKYRPKDGLYFLQLMKWGVLQYCVVRPTTTLAAVILDFIGLYCDSSWSPGWGHIYITIIVSLSVTVAMYCLFQLYIPISEQLAHHKPLLKLFSVKAVVFLTFWQATALSLLSMFGVVKDTPYMTADDINTGIAAILETFEMTCFAILHIRAFSYKPYLPEGQKASDQTHRVHSLIHALDIRDMWQEIQDGSMYMGKTIRGVETEETARRRTHFAKAMGRERELTEAKEGAKEGWAIEDLHRYDEELLLDSRGRGHISKYTWLNDTSDELGIAPEDGDRRKYCKQDLADEYEALLDLAIEGGDLGHTRENSTSWKGTYDPLSRSIPDTELEEQLSSIPHRPSQRHRRRQPPRIPSLDSPPPPSCVMFEYSDLGDGPSRVRLSSFHRLEQPTTYPKEPPNFDLDHHSNSFPSHREMRDGTPATQRGVPIAPQPTSSPQTHRNESLVSSGQTQFSAAAQNDHNSSFPASSSMTRLDSLPPRVFLNSASHTFDGRSPFGDRADTPSTQTIPTSPIAYPASLPRMLLEHMSSKGSRSRESQTQSSPIRGHLRPRIVLPTPLSPTHYLATEVLPRVPEQLPPVDYHSLRDSRSVGGRDIASREFLASNTLADARLGHFTQVQPEAPETTRHHTGFMQLALLREPQTMNPMSSPVVDLVIPDNPGRHTYICTSSHSSPTEENVCTPPGRQAGHLWPSASSTKTKTLPITTSPGSPSFPRQLRHPRGDIGMARRT